MKLKPWQLAVVIGVLLTGLLVGAQLTANRGGPAVEELVAFYEDFPRSRLSIGNPDAPVTVVEYFDFQCPACQVASDNIVKPLIDEHVRAGDVQFVYQFFPILGPESVASAEAAYCAVEQDMFWEYQAALFARKGQGNRGTFSKSNLISYATEVGLDRDAFVDCIEGPQAPSFVANSHQQAINRGLPGTPMFFVNGRNVSGTKQAIDTAIEEALQLAGAGES